MSSERSTSCTGAAAFSPHARSAQQANLVVAVAGAPGIRVPLLLIPGVAVAIDRGRRSVVVVAAIPIVGPVRVVAISYALHGVMARADAGFGGARHGAAGRERQ